LQFILSFCQVSDQYAANICKAQEENDDDDDDDDNYRANEDYDSGEGEGKRSEDDKGGIASVS
jgi:hypothetical protein